ncbi:hypothetical protein FOZ62_017827, partial [Perkinsus olseni]
DTIGEDSEEVKDLHKKLSRVVAENGRAIDEVTGGLRHGLRNITAALVRSALGVKHHYLYGQEVLRKLVDQFRAAMRIEEQAEEERRIKQHTYVITQLLKVAKRQESERAKAEGKSDEALEQNARQALGVADILRKLMVATGAVDNSQLSGARAAE